MMIFFRISAPMVLVVVLVLVVVVVVVVVVVSDDSLLRTHCGILVIPLPRLLCLAPLNNNCSNCGRTVSFSIRLSISSLDI